MNGVFAISIIGGSGIWGWLRIDELIRSRRVLLVAVLAVALAGPRAGADAQPAANAGSSSGHKVFIPAAFRSGEWALSSWIDFPRGNYDLRVAVPCFVIVNRKGRLFQPSCVKQNEQISKFNKKVRQAASRAKMSPALINGRATNVRVSFTAIFERRDGYEKVHTIPHQFLNTEELGTEYYTPQLILHSIKKFPRDCRRNKVVVRILVDETGIPSSPAYHRGGWTGQRCVDTAKDWLLNWRFVPGFVNGKPTAMEYLLDLNWSLDPVLQGRLI